jgi:Ca2+-binding RTX toxin-like protein
VYGQRYNADGTTAGGNFLINTVTDSEQSDPSLVALNDGGFLATWISNAAGQDGSSYGIYGQRYDASGSVVGALFRVNSSTYSSQDTPSVAGLIGGGFVITWQSIYNDVLGWNGSNVYGQRYDAGGTRLGGEFLVNTCIGGTRIESSVVSLADGGFVVSWQSDGNQDGSANGIYAQRYNADGRPWLPQVTGTAGDDTLNFNNSTSALEYIGLAGDDSYVLSTASDQVTEVLNQGTDTISSGFSYVLPDNVENLTLTGTGNRGNNVLDGGAGADTLIGGAGDDTYVVDNTGDVMMEIADQGTDTVRASVSKTLTEDYVENLTLTGTANINGTGNELTNLITGNSGANILTGGLGNDTMEGGGGADTVVYNGNEADYDYSFANGVWTVEDTLTDDGDDGLDTLSI